MVSFIEARQAYHREQTKMLSSIGYSTGIISSMSLQKTRPRFEEVFRFPEDGKGTNLQQAKIMEANMLVWAETLNRAYRKKEKQQED